MAVNLRKNDFLVQLRIRNTFVRAGYTVRVANLDMYYAKAIGYVWGHEDGSGSRVPVEGDGSWEFGSMYSRMAAEFLSEWRTSLPPIPEVFRAWRSQQIERVHGGS